MIFYRAIQEPFMHPEYQRYCLVLQGSHDEESIQEFEVFFEDFNEAYAVWKSFMDRFDFHTDASLDEVVTNFRNQVEEQISKDN